MDCPRCGGQLSTFAVETTDRSAVVCESCGFVGVATSHEPAERDIESWDLAIKRFETASDSPDRSCHVRRADAVSVPTDEPDSTVDAETLEETVAVASALRESERDQDSQERDDS